MPTATKNMLLNVDQPDPRWYRKSKRVIGLLQGTAFLAFVGIFHPSLKTVAVIGQIIAFMPTLIEILSAMLSDGQEFAPAGTKQALADFTGKNVKDDPMTTTPDLTNIKNINVTQVNFTELPEIPSTTGVVITGVEGIDWDWEAIYDSTQQPIGKRKKVIIKS